MRLFFVLASLFTTSGVSLANDQYLGLTGEQIAKIGKMTIGSTFPGTQFGMEVREIDKKKWVFLFEYSGEAKEVSHGIKRPESKVVDSFPLSLRKNEAFADGDPFRCREGKNTNVIGIVNKKSTKENVIFRPIRAWKVDTESKKFSALKDTTKIDCEYYHDD